MPNVLLRPFHNRVHNVRNLYSEKRYRCQYRKSDLEHLRYADDTPPLTGNERDIQTSVNKGTQISQLYDLTMNIKNTKVKWCLNNKNYNLILSLKTSLTKLYTNLNI